MSSIQLKNIQLTWLMNQIYKLKNIEMEKTILYSKKSSSLNFNIKKYQNCQHQHCKQLVCQVKFLSNLLTEKIFKDQSNTLNNVFKEKQNMIDHQLKNSVLNKTLQEQIQNIRKNYTKLRKQLNQLQSQNDELFQQNESLKKKIEKIQANINNKEIFQLSITKCNQTSPNDSKSSCFGVGNAQLEIQNRLELTDKSQYFPNNQCYKQLNLKFQCISPDCRHLSTDRSQIYNKYQKLLKDYHSIQREWTNNEQKIKQYEYANKKLQYQNCQLKKIIKLRNQIQNSRHQMVNNLRSILDEIQA